MIYEIFLILINLTTCNIFLFSSNVPWGLFMDVCELLFLTAEDGAPADIPVPRNRQIIFMRCFKIFLDNTRINVQTYFSFYHITFYKSLDYFSSCENLICLDITALWEAQIVTRRLLLTSSWSNSDIRCSSVLHGLGGISITKHLRRYLKNE